MNERWVIFVLARGADIASHLVLGPYHSEERAQARADRIDRRYGDNVSVMVERLVPQNAIAFALRELAEKP